MANDCDAMVMDNEIENRLPPYTSTSHKVSGLSFDPIIRILTIRPTEPRRHPMCLVSFVFMAPLTTSHIAAGELIDCSVSITKLFKFLPVNSDITCTTHLICLHIIKDVTKRRCLLKIISLFDYIPTDLFEQVSLVCVMNERDPSRKYSNDK